MWVESVKWIHIPQNVSAHQVLPFHSLCLLQIPAMRMLKVLTNAREAGILHAIYTFFVNKRFYLLIFFSSGHFV